MDILVIIAVASIVVLASGYIRKEKKRGVRCIGCGDGAKCSGCCACGKGEENTAQ